MKTSILQSMLKRNANAIHIQEMNVRYFQESYKDSKNCVSGREQWHHLLINSISLARKDIKKLVAIQRAIKAEIKINTYNAKYSMYIKEELKLNSFKSKYYKYINEVDGWIKENNNAI
jgi:hypothetical protein